MVQSPIRAESMQILKHNDAAYLAPKDSIQGLWFVALGDAVALIDAVAHATFEVCRVYLVAGDGECFRRRVNGRVLGPVGAPRRGDIEVIHLR